MAYEHKPNTGTLFPNDKRTKDTQPIMRGEASIDKVFIENEINKTAGAVVKIAISAWPKEINGKQCLSISIGEPYVKQASAVTNPWEA